MATIALTTDTLISTLMPSGGGSLASGDTIQLVGHSLIVDADAVDYPVTIANSGADANLELRDLGRIKLNATLPATVHPYIDPAHPLPVSAEPGIDGDPYRTNLTGNARAEIQLAANFGLGGGAASLPTGTRSGGFWAKRESSPASNQIKFDRDFPLHKGDLIFGLFNAGNQNLGHLAVESYDSETQTATFTSAAIGSDGATWVLNGGGVLFNCVGTSSPSPIFSVPCCGGTINIKTNRSSGWTLGPNAVFECDRFIHESLGINYGGDSVVGQGTVIARQMGTGRAFIAWMDCHAKIGELVCRVLCGNNGQASQPAYFGCNHAEINGGFSVENEPYGWFDYTLRNFTLPAMPQLNYSRGKILAEKTTINATYHASTQIESSGTISKENGTYYHAPSTASDVTWRYTDRTVAPGATLRLRCAWIREGSSATRASVAVTDPATWWPSIWQLGADALASVEFTGVTADLRSELLTWRNTGAEAATVRVWECVTGTSAGGYLRVEEVKGGAL